MFLSTHTGIFLDLIWGGILAPWEFRNKQKIPKFVYTIPIFLPLVLYFGENFMKIRRKIPKRQMNENLHKNVKHFHSHFYATFHEFFYGGQLKQQICYSFTLLISYMFFNPFKMAVQVSLDFIKFSQF